jgi:hypothetical protein
MTHGFIQRFLACLLVISLLVIGGLASAQSLTHEFQHSHHQKATHGTVLCSWMCAAGQAGEAAALLIPLDFIPHDFIELTFSDHLPTSFTSVLATRGPPLSFTI